MKATPCHPLPCPYPSFRMGCLAAAALSLMVASATAAPANDNFANAVVLSGSSVSTTGDTTGATLESGEFNPRNSGGVSVWYQWTAPATGWYEVSTATDDPDYDLDTVIALHRNGTSAANAPVMGFNDDGLGFYDPDSDEFIYQSRLVFYTTAGTVHRIAVHGYDGEEGAFELHINAVPPPAARVVGVSFDPPTVDISDGPAGTTVELRIQSEDEFTGGSLDLFSPDAGFMEFVSLGSDDRISGDGFDGDYETFLNVPAFLQPGLFGVRVYLENDLAWSSWSNEGPDQLQDFYLIPGSAPLTVTNTGDIDSEAPVLVGLTGLPASVDLSGGPVSFTVQIEVSDDLSGFSYGYLHFRNDDFSHGYGYYGFYPDDLVSGDPQSGVVELEVTLDPLDFPPGSYWVEVSLTDLVGNWVNYSSSGFYEEDLPLPPGVPVSILVEGDAPLSGYAAWAVGKDFGPLGLSAPEDDPNHDSIPNLLCYAFNLEPNGPPARPMIAGNGDLSGLPAISLTGAGAQRRLRIEYLRRITPGHGLAYTTQFGSGFDAVSLQDVDNEVSSTLIDTNWERVIAEDLVQGALTRFGRVGVGQLEE